MTTTPSIAFVSLSHTLVRPATEPPTTRMLSPPMSKCSVSAGFASVVGTGPTSSPTLGTSSAASSRPLISGTGTRSEALKRAGVAEGCAIGEFSGAATRLRLNAGSGSSTMGSSLAATGLVTSCEGGAAGNNGVAGSTPLPRRSNTAGAVRSLSTAAARSLSATAVRSLSAAAAAGCLSTTASVVFASGGSCGGSGGPSLAMTAATIPPVPFAALGRITVASPAPSAASMPATRRSYRPTASAPIDEFPEFAEKPPFDETPMLWMFLRLVSVSVGSTKLPRRSVGWKSGAIKRRGRQRACWSASSVRASASLTRSSTAPSAAVTASRAARTVDSRSAPEASAMAVRVLAPYAFSSALQIAFPTE
mmetsp:Transcript_43866/g.108530  ORF Transcript_43866/g.108530 Transcript_43866/m.108530 type:complete len:364 (+) Transcript_43866:1163-2254(+)